MTPLIRFFVDLEKIYNPCLILYQEDELRELNKKHKTPTLNHQLTGKWAQDNHSFDPTKKDNNACLVCNHKSTMGMGNEETNTTNSSHCVVPRPRRVMRPNLTELQPNMAVNAYLLVAMGFLTGEGVTSVLI